MRSRNNDDVGLENEACAGMFALSSRVERSGDAACVEGGETSGECGDERERRGRGRTVKEDRVSLRASDA